MNDYKLICTDCGNTYDKQDVEYTCLYCSQKQEKGKALLGVLKVEYNYEEINKRLKRNELRDSKRRGLDRYFHLLPLKNESVIPPISIGNTPLENVERLRNKLGIKSLYVKNDSLLLTGSLKDRASALVVAKAKELGKDIITTASTGNAATALAGICAASNIKSIIFVPENAPKAKLTQIAMYGATLIPVKGTYDDAFALCVKASKKYGWYNRNTAYNPYTIEGKKTVAFEIWEQLGNKVPDKILIPTGDGVILTGVYKGFYDLIRLGWIDKMPQLIAVQAKGSSAIADAFERCETEITPLKKVNTIADSISVASPACGNFALKVLKETKGFAIKVDDKEILQAIKELATFTGIFAEPAAASVYAGLIKGLKEDKIDKQESIVLLITGTGLKDIDASMKVVDIPKPIKPKDWSL